MAQFLRVLIRPGASDASGSLGNRTAAPRLRVCSMKADIGYRVIAIAACSALIGMGLPDFRDHPLKF